jgi:hypothetical protein
MPETCNKEDNDMPMLTALAALPARHRTVARLMFLASLAVALVTLGAPALVGGAVAAGWLSWLLRPQLQQLRDRFIGHGHQLRCAVLLDDRDRATALAAVLGRGSRELARVLGAIPAGSGLCVVATLSDDHGKPLNALLLARSPAGSGTAPIGWIAARDRSNDEIFADLAWLQMQLAAALPPNARYERTVEGGTITGTVPAAERAVAAPHGEPAPPIATADANSTTTVFAPAPATADGQLPAEALPRAARGIRARAWVTDPLAPRDEPPSAPPTRGARAG